ncbi:PAS fold-containing protein [Alkalispirochaeta americana]|uniref:histidine kinase n=2 Tax=Alkalispirochaeta americana TaxID=159291 RepID=A0A1N6WWF4_9SPIO|nr:PAS fold-containing protein [Alkalispirochaeta americana]
MRLADSGVREELFRFCLEEASFYVLLLDSQGTVLDANRYAAQLFGEDPRGRPFSEMTPGFSHGDDRTALEELARAPQMITVSCGEHLPQTLQVRLVPLGDKGWLFLGELPVEELVGLQQTLTSLNAEASNLNRELYKKNAELKKLNDLKNQFVGMAAHDLRNPISAIFSLSSFLLDNSGEALSDDQSELLDMIKASSNFMLRLLDDLLTLARIEMGKLNLDIELLEIQPFLRKIIRVNQILADRKQITLHLVACDEVPPLAFDALKIEQVLNNLISNAVKFSPSGESVDIAVLRGAEQVVFTVSDRGPGVPEEDQHKLFKAFAKISVKLPENETSTGLGLSIAQKIVLGHLGTIWYEPRPGGGSSFCFSLPLKSVIPPKNSPGQKTHGLE